MPKIFISYRREGTPGTTGRLADRLKPKFGRSNVFHDVTAIRAGQDWPKRLRKEVETSDVMLVMIGRYWNSMQNLERLKDPKDWLFAEINTGFRAGLRIVPVLIDGGSIPEAAQLPKGMKNLPRRQAMRIRNASFDSDLANLIEQLEKVPQRKRPGTPPQPGAIEENPVDGLKYVWVPAGQFVMGAVEEDPDAQPDEKPCTQIEINRGFWLCRTEVTVDAYRQFAGRQQVTMPAAWKGNPGWSRPNHPMVKVSWDKARAYCDWTEGRLPTEAEWEYAARGGVAGRRFPFDKKTLTHDDAKYVRTKGKQQFKFANPVDWSRLNGFDLFDMAGNVWEWVADWYDPGEYQRRATRKSRTDPTGPAEATGKRIVRGGSWNDKLPELRVSNRRALEPETISTEVGFRCLLDRMPS